MRTKIILEVEESKALEVAQEVEELKGVKGLKLNYDTRPKKYFKRK